jgi:hypothetical protein
MTTLQPGDSTDRTAALDEAACRLEAAARLLAYVRLARLQVGTIHRLYLATGDLHEALGRAQDRAYDRLCALEAPR